VESAAARADRAESGTHPTQGLDPSRPACAARSAWTPPSPRTSEDFNSSTITRRSCALIERAPKRGRGAALGSPTRNQRSCAMARKGSAAPPSRVFQHRPNFAHFHRGGHEARMKTSPRAVGTGVHSLAGSHRDRRVHAKGRSSRRPPTNTGLSAFKGRWEQLPHAGRAHIYNRPPSTPLKRPLDSRLGPLRLEDGRGPHPAPAARRSASRGGRFRADGGGLQGFASTTFLGASSARRGIQRPQDGASTNYRLGLSGKPPGAAAIRNEFPRLSWMESASSDFASLSPRLPRSWNARMGRRDPDADTRKESRGADCAGVAGVPTLPHLARRGRTPRAAGAGHQTRLGFTPVYQGRNRTGFYFTQMLGANFISASGDNWPAQPTKAARLCRRLRGDAASVTKERVFAGRRVCFAKFCTNYPVRKVGRRRRGHVRQTARAGGRKEVPRGGWRPSPARPCGFLSGPAGRRGKMQRSSSNPGDVGRGIQRWLDQEPSAPAAGWRGCCSPGSRKKDLAPKPQKANTGLQLGAHHARQHFFLDHKGDDHPPISKLPRALYSRLTLDGHHSPAVAVLDLLEGSGRGTR